nr:MAG TPA: hypothetical protein [Bacteriophage sp.]
MQIKCYIICVWFRGWLDKTPEKIRKLCDVYVTKRYSRRDTLIHGVSGSRFSTVF